MWLSLVAVAILSAAAILMADASSVMPRSGFQLARTGSSRVDYSRTYCVSFPERGEAPPFIAKQCVPGSTFKVACNRCLCRQSGNSAICTKKNCNQELRSSGCEPGSVKAVECNNCICSPAGRWACTQRQCRSGISYVACNRDVTETADARMGPQKCKPGSSFMNGCDRCYCANDGVSAVCRSRPCNGVTGKLVSVGAVPDDAVNAGATQTPGVIGIPTFQNETHSCYSLGPIGFCFVRQSVDAGAAQMPGLIGNPNFQNETHSCYSLGPIGFCFVRQSVDGAAQMPGGVGIQNFKNETHSCYSLGPITFCLGQQSVNGAAQMPGGVGIQNFQNESHSCYSLGPITFCLGQQSVNGAAQMPGVIGIPTFQNETHSCYSLGPIGFCFVRQSVDGAAIMPGGVGIQNFQNETHSCYSLGPITLCLGQQSVNGAAQMPGGVGIQNFQNETHSCYSLGPIMLCLGQQSVNGFRSREQQKCTNTSCEQRRITHDVSCTPGTTFMDKCNICWCGPGGKTAACTKKHCSPGSH